MNAKVPETAPRSILLLLLIAATALTSSPARGADVPSPESHLGYRPGADYHLAAWPEVVSYFKKVDAASDRVTLDTLGESTEGRPFVAAIVSNAETIRDLARYKAMQASLHDPRRLSGEDAAPKAVADSKPVVVITCSIHSTETASTLMAMELLHELASRDDAATREILDRTILVLVPSVNPDGVDKVASWYETTRGKPYEGSGMIELYHKYAGHDTNRDWFMINLKETQLVSRRLYRDWFPTMLYDVHQMGSTGARLFVPPFYDPINPNLDPRIHQGIFTIGAHMAADLAAAGKKGVLTNAMYDNWWNGGNRTTPQRHNIVGVLTEAASVKMATPIFLGRDDLKGAARGFVDHRPAVNFVDPWPGGWWRLRDIVDYELICARSILTLAARYREDFQRNLLAMSRDAIKAGQTSPPYAWVVPSDQPDPGSAFRMIRALHDAGIEVHRASEPFHAAGAEYPAGSWVLPAAQPYRAHLKDMMERQKYPNRLTNGGKAEPPYDVAGWTLPLQMGVRVAEIDRPLSPPGAPLSELDAPRGGIDGSVDRAAYFRLSNRSPQTATLVAALQKAGCEVGLIANRKADRPPGVFGPGDLIVKADEAAKGILERLLPSTSVRVGASGEDPTTVFHTIPVKPRRVGIYQPWSPSMDEGWTRLVLETFALPYTTIHNEDLRVGKIRERFDVLLFPSIESKTLSDGYGPNETDPDHVGGLGTEGAVALREFVRDGGRLVCLDDSCAYAIEVLNLPVKDVLKGVPTSEFYAPGSILRTTFTREPIDGLTSGHANELAVYFDRSKAFEPVGRAGDVRIILRYADSQPLESGWLLGPGKIEGKAALVRVEEGNGSVILFGFRPQHRAQTYGTFRLLFNALFLP